MTKIYSIISLNGFMYMVDKEANLKTGDKGLAYLGIKNPELVLVTFNEPDKKTVNEDDWLIVASNDKSLGLPILPNIEKSLHDQMLDEYPDFIFLPAKEFNEALKNFSKQKAKKWTDEDMRKLYEGTLQNVGTCIKKEDMPTWEQVLKSLNPLPIAVEIERVPVDPYSYDSCNDLKSYIPKVDENNIIQTVKWVYEKS